ncbi:MAG TPA: VWA domain-containing protein [Pyrinomonadaceae bacterium]|jgi:Ca-activated chloride channel family protein|nr:VWA domain-containing protein [Pyrinomonadaceae bacterium]
MSIRVRRLNTRALVLFVCGLLALSLLVSGAFAQGEPTGTQDLPPPPVMPTPKPKPTPTPEEPPDDAYDVVRVSSNLVVVPVSVTDATGQPVLGLTAPDFRLEEEGRAQEIAQIGNPEQVPLDIAILLDVSGSINARFAFEREAASRFLKQVLKPADRATVYAIDQVPRLELARDTAERAAAKLMAIDPAKGPTAFYDTVIEASHYLSQSSPAQHRRVIVVISDGEDNYSEKVKSAIGATRQEQDEISTKAKGLIYNRILMEVQREVQSAEVTFYSINPSGEALRLNIISQRAQDGMQQLANATGGNSFVPERLENLDAVFRQIAAELRSQYLLQYYSKDESPTGKFLRIRVTTPSRPQLRVRARQGYYSRRR